MAGETRQLAEFASRLRYEDIPEAVRRRAGDSITDTTATMIFGRRFPWSEMIIAYARATGSGGRSRILGDGVEPVAAPYAALANGALAHAFELDGALRPSCGAHPGATIYSAVLAVAQEQGFGGRDLLTGFIAGTEIMVRIGLATLHSNETRGFHAPGTTGTFGAAVGCGRLQGFDEDRMANAMGIAGSLSSGLVEFSRAGNGAMVKRLHMGRAAEGGVMASRLAASGFTGPDTVLEGECGFLKVFCNEHDLSELTRGLGSTWHTARLSMKGYACHTAAHTPIQAIMNMKTRHGLVAADVETITIETGRKELSRHVIYHPADVMMAQYSVPFSVALALVSDPTDPRVFRDVNVADERLLELAGRVRLVPWAAPGRPTPIASTVRVGTKQGNELVETVVDIKGTPDSPFSPVELRGKFLKLTRDYDQARMADMFRRLQALEEETSLDWISA